MVASIQMRWSGERQLELALSGGVDERLRRVIAGEFMYHADVATNFAKENAPWTDRTGNARAGLHSGVSEGLKQDFFELYLAHTVFYGIYLETRWSGKYQIIAPTILYIGSMLIERLSSVFERIEAGA